MKAESYGIEAHPERKGLLRSPSPRVWALAEEWLDERRTVGRGISSQTEAAYRRDLTSWGSVIADIASRPEAEDGSGHDTPFEAELGRLELSDITSDNVKRALAALARQDYAPASRARMLASLRGFCRWLVISGHLPTDPTVHLGNPAIPDRLPAAFLPAELEAIVRTVSQPDPSARFPWPKRDRAIVAILAGAGLRASECVALKVQHLVREDPPFLIVTGKGNKERRPPIPEEVVEAVDDYLAEREQRLGKAAPHDTLLVRYNGLPFTREALNYHVYRWLLRAGVHKPQGEAAHAFRHTYAKGLVAKGVPLPSVQALLGHASLNTTQIYLRMTGAELADAVQAAEIREYLRETRDEELSSASHQEQRA
ncbi:MAG: tyrosine-type recombinase/integrase [Actinomycetota bacterium]|nr:tyrosine-type recombinase/integrase [Actinomycetota bacterium]